MNYQDIVSNLDEQTVAKLNQAVETGRWENGEQLTEKQIETSMQAVMLWQASSLKGNVDEPFKVNQKGEFKIGKGDAVNKVPLEFRSDINENIIIKQKLD